MYDGKRHNGWFEYNGWFEGINGNICINMFCKICWWFPQNCLGSMLAEGTGNRKKNCRSF